MLRFFVVLFCLASLFSCPAAVQAQDGTRKRPDPLVVEWDELVDQELRVSNPLYEENANQGENPLYEPASLIFQPSEFWMGTAVRFELQLDAELPPGVSVPQESYVFDVKLFDVATNQSITEFPEGLTFAFSLPHLTPEEEDDMVLGYLDESTNPPTWRTEDGGLDSCGTTGEKVLCGKTDHLTTFVIGPTAAIPEPGSAAIVVGLMVVGAVVKRRTHVSPVAKNNR